MNDLPDDVEHFQAGFIPIPMLLSRLAQRGHNELRDVIVAMSRIQVAKQPSNSNSVSYSPSLPNDDSKENLQKKSILLNYAQKQHENWVKALIITNWSRHAEDISKLVDLVQHMYKQNAEYIAVRDALVENKESFTFARVPSPDIKTALQVLSHGTFPAFPDYGFVDPPLLSPEKQVEFMNNLDTLLSLRLNIDDHDSIPFHFRKFTVHNGRVTFVVEGEFEVDLTIANDDFTQQYWFVDFRFRFAPSPSDWSRTVQFLESKVNEALQKNGLEGCYKILHEIVLTYKINEYRRQALDLHKHKWVGTLGIESLNRGAGIQYWVGRYRNGPKSWILLGVSGNRKLGSRAACTGSHVVQAPTSCIIVRWFRDGAEVKDDSFSIDEARVSTESLLRTVTGRHIEYILSTIHKKLLSRPRFATRENGVSLSICQSDPGHSTLTMDLDRQEKLEVNIDPMTGFFKLSPKSRITSIFEQRLNISVRDPTDEGVACMEAIRTSHFMEEMRRRAMSSGWKWVSSPVSKDDLKQVLNTREPSQYAWLKRGGWDSRWYMMLSLSLTADKWYLMEIPERKPEVRRNNPVKSHVRLPVTTSLPTLKDAFFTDLTTFVSGIMAHWSDLNELHRRHINHKISPAANPSWSRHAKIPDIHVSLSMLIGEASSGGRHREWAHDWVAIEFRGIHRAPGSADTPEHATMNVVMNARLTVTDKLGFGLIRHNVGKDVLFNKRKGTFSLRLSTEVGKSVIDTLASRLQAIERLAEFVAAINKGGSEVHCEEATLRKIVFTYGDTQAAVSTLSTRNAGNTFVQQATSADSRKYKATLDLSDPERVKVILDENNPHLRVQDLLNNLVNSKKQLELLPRWLSVTLSLFKTLDAMEDAWGASASLNHCRLTILPRAIDWIVLRVQHNPTKSTARPLHIAIDIKLRMRSGSPWWRIQKGDGTASYALTAISPAATATATRMGVSNAAPADIDRLLDAAWTKAAALGPGRVKKLGNTAVAMPEAIKPVMAALTSTLTVLMGDRSQPVAVPIPPQQHHQHQEAQQATGSWSGQAGQGSVSMNVVGGNSGNHPNSNTGIGMSSIPGSRHGAGHNAPVVVLD